MPQLNGSRQPWPVPWSQSCEMRKNMVNVIDIGDGDGDGVRWQMAIYWMVHIDVLFKS